MQLSLLALMILTLLAQYSALLFCAAAIFLKKVIFILKKFILFIAADLLAAIAFLLLKYFVRVDFELFHLV